MNNPDLIAKLTDGITQVICDASDFVRLYPNSATCSLANDSRKLLDRFKKALMIEKFTIHEKISHKKSEVADLNNAIRLMTDVGIKYPDVCNTNQLGKYISDFRKKRSKLEVELATLQSATPSSTHVSSQVYNNINVTERPDQSKVVIFHTENGKPIYLGDLIIPIQKSGEPVATTGKCVVIGIDHYENRGNLICVDEAGNYYSTNLYIIPA